MANTNSNKQAQLKSLKKAMTSLKKEYGKGVVMKMSDKPLNIQAYPSGSLALDKALGIGGYPKGRIIELYGPDSAGKTTMALEAVAQVQKQGGIAAYIDAENALNPAYAKSLGVDLSSLILSQPDYGEQGMQVCRKLAASDAIDFVVIDSVAALVPKQDIESGIGNSRIGLQAQLMSQGLRLLNGILSKTGTTLMFLNQTRDKVGVMFGSPETTSGGKSLGFYASQRIRISRGKPVKQNGSLIGFDAKLKVKKNKVAAPGRTAIVPLMNGTNGVWGIDSIGELIDLATEYNVMDKGGAWFTFPDGNRIQGKINAADYLRKQPDMAKKMSVQVKNKMGVPLSDDEKKVLKSITSTDSSSSNSTTKDTSKTSTKKSSKK